MPRQTKTNLKKISRQMRRHILDMAYRSKTGHIGPALCITDILAVLYFRILNLKPNQPDWPQRDRFILSKGHASAALYAALALRGFFHKKILQSYRVNKGRLHSHPCNHDVPGIEFSTGSLGHGLPVSQLSLIATTSRDSAPPRTLINCRWPTNGCLLAGRYWRLTAITTNK
ncbi:MAG: Transketolase subunit A [Parcubacteria group bacterium GW2011_GWA2_43_9b]|nr:MAG: Transketolase subunit A [Parcubacteria group bacterium GW2011_GWA2_43_9b]